MRPAIDEHLREGVDIDRNGSTAGLRASVNNRLPEREERAEDVAGVAEMGSEGVEPVPADAERRDAAGVPPRLHSPLGAGLGRCRQPYCVVVHGQAKDTGCNILKNCRRSTVRQAVATDLVHMFRINQAVWYLSQIRAASSPNGALIIVCRATGTVQRVFGLLLHTSGCCNA